jgi:hypothetical protein
MKLIIKDIIMLTAQNIPGDFVEIIITEILDAQTWHDYQDLVWNTLEHSLHKRYFLLNVTDLESVDPNIIKEFGTARHLKHPLLGCIVMLGSTSLQNFLLKMTETKAARTQGATGVLIQTDRAHALTLLEKRRELNEEIERIQQRAG